MPQEQSYLSYFTPSQMSAEMLEAILVKRQSLAARLVQKTKQSVLTPTKHQTLLLGPRGMGKSYLAALVYHRIKARPELEDKIAIAYFAEEEWSITSLTDLLLVILKSLDREYGGLQTRIDALYRLPIRDIESAASTLVREFMGDRTLFLLVENLDEIFRGLGDQGQWAFRSFISERPFVTILATTPSLFSGITEHDSAFYGFFQNIYLDELTVEEATELLEKAAKRRDDTALATFLKTPTAMERVQAVHDLAGGHPRIYLLFAHLLTQETLDELVTPFMKLLDELTPYYQSRMQMLSPQQRKVIEFLCSARGAISVKEIAAQNLMTPQTASSQLDKLEEMAYVRKTPVGRESLYELREPLLRMIIEVKRGRGEPVRLIVDFLRRWYNRRERQERLSSASSEFPLTYAYLVASLDLKHAIQDAPDLKRAQRFSAEYDQCFEARQYDRACDLAAEIIERKGKASSLDDWFEYAICLYLTRQYVTALPIWDEIVNHRPDDASGWCGHAITQNTLGNASGAVASYDKALSLTPNDPTLWTFRGNALQHLGDDAAALASYDMALAIDPMQVYTLHYRGIVLGKMGDNLAALSSFDMALKIDPTDVHRWFHHAEAQLAIGNWEECVHSIERGFALVPKKDSTIGNAPEFCRLMLRYEDVLEKIKQLTRLYTKNDALDLLGQGLIESIPSVLERRISQSVAEEWQAAWKGVQDAGTELDIPLRILTAAIEWKKTRNVRALLTLPIEERRILESLLPKTEATGAS
ncbi:MAG: repeat-containing protein [Chthonomonadaceae bacterium]|nr:repeat-containing protein [Chthonomonadaceae bacterium]